MVIELIVLVFACSLSFLFGGLLAIRGVRFRLYEAGETMVSEGKLRYEALAVLLAVVEGRR